MNLTIENILLVGSILLLISLIAGRTSYKYGVPTLLLFLAIGMLAGSDGIGGIYFDNPKTAQFIGVVALNFILFSGGLNTNWKSVKPIWKEGFVLSTFGVIITALTLGLFVWMVTNFTFYESMLLGSIVSSTDAAAVFSILRSKSVALRANIRPTLEFESGSNDPMAYVLTILFLSLVVNQDQSITSVIPVFLQQMILGAIAGFGFGFLCKFILNRINLGYEGLYPVLVIVLMFITFSATDFVGGNGFLAIYICAIYLGNQDFIHKRSVLQMFDGLAWLNQIVLFLTLGLLVYPSRIIPILGIGVLISLFLMLVARPISVFLALSPFKMKLRRRTYIAWVGLRGAVPIVFATYPLLAGIEHADMIFSIVFFISVTSVLLQGTSLSLVAKWLNVAIPKTEKPVSETEKLTLELPKPYSKDFLVLPGFFAVNKKIVDLDFPDTILILVIKREGQYIRPDGATKIQANDILTILAEKEEDYDMLEDYFIPNQLPAAH